MQGGLWNLQHQGHDACVCRVLSDSLIPWTVACQAPLSIGICRQEYWSGLPCPPPGDLPNPGVKPVYRVSPELAGWVLHQKRHLGSPVLLFGYDQIPSLQESALWSRQAKVGPDGHIPNEFVSLRFG